MIHKAVKNQTEITGAISAHIKDGVAVTNFLYWLENNIDSEITDTNIRYWENKWDAL